MSLRLVSAAVEARLGAWIAAAPESRPPLRTSNAQDGDTPPDGKPYLSVQYPLNRSWQASTGVPGANVYRTEGVIRLVLNVESGAGTDQGLAWCDDLASLFRGKTFDGVRTFAPAPPTIDDRNRDGPFYTLSVAVPYEFDELG